MKLEDLMDVIDESQEIELYKGDRIGVFKKDDTGLESYLDYRVDEISVSDKRLRVYITY